MRALNDVSADVARGPRGPLALIGLCMLALCLFTGFAALGTWQVYRRAWKLDLIARVDQRVHAPASIAPGPSAWSTVTAENDEYRHVRLQGHYLYDRQTLVWASSELGNGVWVMTPLRLADGSSVLVNRGFVPGDMCQDRRRCANGPEGDTRVSGLLRISQTHAFLRHDDPAQERWYARNVQAIAAARGLDHVAPYFVDADAAADPAAWPRGGLTVIRFPNNHLSYLITWYLLALGVLFGAIVVGREEWKLRRGKLRHRA
jgi:surfeit locus 1 family protein